MFKEGDSGILTLGAHLSYEDLAPLTLLPHLQEFILHYCEPVSMTDDQLHTLLLQCPSLTAVELNQEPMVLSAPKLTINVLPLLAQSCPKLESLALICGDGYRNRRDTDSLHFREPFRNQFRVSSLRYNDRSVLPLLAQVLPEDCKITAESPYPEDVQKLLDPDWEQGRQSRRNAWTKVANWMPILMDVRRQSASRALREREQPRTLSPEDHDTPRPTIKKEE